MMFQYIWNRIIGQVASVCASHDQALTEPAFSSGSRARPTQTAQGDLVTYVMTFQRNRRTMQKNERDWRSSQTPSSQSESSLAECHSYSNYPIRQRVATPEVRGCRKVDQPSSEHLRLAPDASTPSAQKLIPVKGNRLGSSRIKGSEACLWLV